MECQETSLFEIVWDCLSKETTLSMGLTHLSSLHPSFSAPRREQSGWQLLCTQCRSVAPQKIPNWEGSHVGAREVPHCICNHLAPMEEVSPWNPLSSRCWEKNGVHFVKRLYRWCTRRHWTDCYTVYNWHKRIQVRVREEYVDSNRVRYYCFDIPIMKITTLKSKWCCFTEQFGV